MITIKQLSIFLENKNGRINDVAKVLAKEGINMRLSVWPKPPTSGFAAHRFRCRESGKRMLNLRFCRHASPMSCAYNAPTLPGRSPQFSTTSLPKISLSNTCMHSPKEIRHEQSFVPPI